jgi:hypothetical protein
MPPPETDNQQPATPLCKLVAALSLWLLMTPGPTCAQDDDARYLNELRSRRFFSLAARYCHDELAIEKQSSRQTDLAMELSRTLVEHGKFLPTSEREAMWQSADKVLFDQSGRSPEDDLKVRLQAQQAINESHQATFLRWQSQVTPQDNYLKELALLRIMKAQKTLASAANRAKNAAGNSPFHRDRLRNTLDYHQGQAIMDQARLEEPQSAERLSLAAKAETIVKRLASTAVDNSTRVDARVLFAECCRERGDARRAVSALDGALKLASSDEDRDRIMAERIRVMLYQQRADEAIQQLISWRKSRGSLSGELHFLRMQSLIAMWELARAAKNEQVSDELIRQMEVGSNYTKQEVGGYWSARCDELFNRARELATLGSKLAKLKQQAERDFAAGKLQAAAGNFGLAADEAVRKEKPEVAARLFFQQGSLLVQTKNLAAAATAFRRAAVAGEIKDGNDAHLMQAWCLGRLYQENSTREHREAYTASLNEHRNLYESSPTFGEATYMLASLEETRLQNTRAIEFYKQVRVQHQRYKSCSAGIARCYTKVLNRLKGLNNPRLLAEWLLRAAADIDVRLQELPPHPQPLDLNQSETAIYGASIMLMQSAPDYEVASGYLRRGTESLKQLKPTPKTVQLNTVAERWRLITAIAGGRTEDAMQWVNSLQGRSGPELLAVMKSLDNLTNNDRQSRITMAAVRLQIGELALSRRQELTPAQQLELSTWMVGTYFDSGRRPQALQQAEQTISASRNPEALSKVSGLVQTLKTKEGQTLARRGWQKLQSTTKAGSPTWLNARLHIAECTLGLGEVTECRKLLRVTKLLYPELGGPQLKAAFNALELSLAVEP